MWSSSLRLISISFEQRSWLTFSSSNLLDKREYCQRSHNSFLNVSLNIRSLPTRLTCIDCWLTWAPIRPRNSSIINPRPFLSQIVLVGLDLETDMDRIIGIGEIVKGFVQHSPYSIQNLVAKCDPITKRFWNVPKEIFFPFIPYCDQVGGAFPTVCDSFLNTFIVCSIKSHFRIHIWAH